MARKRHAERQQDIIQAALALIAEEGVQSLTTARLAQRVGVSEAALYRHFANKQDMVGATIDAVGERVLHRLSRWAEGARARDRLRGVLRHHLAFVAEHPGVARILFSDEVHFNAPALRGKLHGVIERYLGYVESLVRAGISDGEFRADLDPRAAAVLVLGAVQSQVLLWSLSGGGHGMTAQVDRLWETIERGLA